MTARRLLAPLILGIGGVVFLASMGVWQVQRLAWKEGVLAEIEERIAGPVGQLPEVPEAGRDRFLPVEVSGDFDGADVPVFLSHTGGPIYRLVAAFETEAGRRIMVDRGAISALERHLAAAGFECRRADRGGVANLIARWGDRGHARRLHSLARPS